VLRDERKTKGKGNWTALSPSINERIGRGDPPADATEVLAFIGTCMRAMMADSSQHLPSSFE
jgi:hypothetical protein